MKPTRTKSGGNVQAAGQPEPTAWVLPAKVEGGKFTGKQKKVVEEYGQRSPQRAAIVEVLYSYAAEHGKKGLTLAEAREAIKKGSTKIPSEANQDRWRLFRWHKARLIEDGFLQPAAKRAGRKAVSHAA